MALNNKFIINKEIDNEFIFTIKKSLEMVPMVISETGTQLPEVVQVIQPSYSTTPAVEYVPASPGSDLVPAVPGQEFIASVSGLPEVYEINVKTLETEVGQLDYFVVIDTETFTIDNVVYEDAYGMLIAMAATINASGTVVATAVVDENTLVITGKTDGLAYTVNTSDNLYVNQVQDARTEVIGQEYIEAQAEIPAVAPTSEVLASPEYYTSTQEPVIVDLSTSIPNNFTNDIDVDITLVSGSISDLLVNNVSVIPVGNVYSIANAQSFTVIPVDEGTNTVLPASIGLKANISLTGASVDTFVAKLFTKRDDTLVATVSMVDDLATGVITIEDAINGQIKLTLYDTLVSTLVTERGDRADGYYPKAPYRMIIEADTLNNGKFPVVIDDVYVR